MSQAVLANEALMSRYPFGWIPDNPPPGYRFVLSRYPTATGTEAFGPVWASARAGLEDHGVRTLLVQTPLGPVILAGLQLRSPRTAERWKEGNEQASMIGASLSRLAASTEAPIIVAGDLNTAPVGRRSELLGSAAGLRRAKPAWVIDGTYPAHLPAPLRTAIDDAMVTVTLGVASWSTVAIPGSDHRAVIVELRRSDQSSDVPP
jgi:endonuclease/exonuclease/phosphatase family metal-dependent hydrolase